jgi:hypothetical protein
MTTNEAMTEVMQMAASELADKLGIPYNTATSYRYKYRNNMLSLEKQIEILSKLNFKPKTQLTWNKNKAK